MNPDWNAAEFLQDRDDVFTRIAKRYDRLCDIFSVGAHRYWKNTMAARMALDCNGTILDVASGTGDIPYRLLRRLKAAKPQPFNRLIVSDTCSAMLALAKERMGAETEKIEFKIYDGHDLSEVADNSIQIYSISFAMKICDRKRIMAEALRVLVPGGRFYCLEAAAIPLAPVHRLYLLYMDWCLPIIARLATGGDTSAYQYLLKGVHDFPAQGDFVRELQQAGFVDVSYENLTFGIVALHAAIKP